MGYLHNKPVKKHPRAFRVAFLPSYKQIRAPIAHCVHCESQNLGTPNEDTDTMLAARNGVTERDKTVLDWGDVRTGLHP